MKKKSNGFTLIEIIIVIAILGIVLTMAFNFFTFNLRTYNKGENRAAVQFDVRMASDFITDELRNVNIVSITDTALTSSIGLGTLTAKYPLVTGVTFEIVTEAPKYFVQYTVSGNSTDGNNPYSLTTKVLLNNITSATVGSGTDIYFTK